MNKPSVGKAASDALATWLSRSLTADIKVWGHWPAANVKLNGRAISIVHAGRRVRDESYGNVEITNRVNISATQAVVRFRQGDVTQPLQLDVWANSDDGRDDVIRQLDQVLHAGRQDTLNTPNSVITVLGDPWSDELVLAFDPNGDFVGDYCTFQFDDFSVDDTPDSIQRCEYRATAIGESRMPYSYFRTVPRLIKASVLLQATETPETAFNSSLPYTSTTVAVNPAPPPAIKVTHGKGP